MAGTLTCLGPLLMVRVTAEPICTSLPAAGSVLTAWPAGMVALVFCSVAAHDETGGRDGGVGVGLGEALDLGHEGEGRTGAHACSRPRCPRPRRCRLGGAWDRTVFLGLASSTTLLVPTLSSAASMAALASGCSRPTMAGTLTCLGPLLTVRVTAEPVCTSLPAAGSVLTAWPAGMVALVFCSVAAHDETGGRDGGVGVGLGEALDLGHEGEGRAGAHACSRPRCRRRRRCRARRSLGQDGVLGAGVLDDAAGAHAELGSRRWRPWRRAAGGPRWPAR